MNLEQLNVVTLLVCIAIGQVFLTIWFVPLFGKPWARAYGVDDPKEHTKAVPAYTYAIGAGCVLLLSVGLSLLQAWLRVETVGEALLIGLFVAIHFSIATALPGYAFLRRWRAFFLAIGSQTSLILILSAVIALLG